MVSDMAESAARHPLIYAVAYGHYYGTAVREKRVGLPPLYPSHAEMDLSLGDSPDANRAIIYGIHYGYEDGYHLS